MKKSLFMVASVFSILSANSVSAYYCSECGSYSNRAPNGYYSDDRNGGYYRGNSDYRNERYPKPSQDRDYDDQNRMRDGSYDSRYDGDQRDDNSGRYYPKPSQGGDYRDGDSNDRGGTGDGRSDQSWSDQDGSRKAMSVEDRKIQTRIQKNLSDKKVLAHPEMIQIWILEGEATLRGKVKSEDEKAKLKDFVKGQEGVKSVTDKVTVDSNIK